MVVAILFVFSCPNLILVPLGVVVYHGFGEFTGMVTVAAATRIVSVKDGALHPIDGSIHDRKEGGFLEFLLQIHW